MKIHNISGLPTIDYRTIKPLQGNLKDLEAKNYDRLLRVLNKRGFTTPLFVWQNPEDKALYLLDGHQRQRVMTKADLNDDGNYEVPYALIPGDTLQEAKEQLLEITSQYGHMTMEGLDEFAFDLDLTALDVNFDALDLDKFLDGLHDEEIEEDEAPEVDEANPPVSVLGEVYQLGRHRLMCGSSTDKENIDTLTNKTIPDMVFTDPPYGVDYSSRVDEERRKGWGGIINDNLKGEELQNFLSEAVAIHIGHRPTYICCNWQSYSDFEAAFGKPNALIVWDKQSIGLGAGYRNQHEFILFYGKLDHNSESNVWQLNRDSSGDYKHPTQKPVGIPARGIKNSSKADQVVLDLFGGSGSTLMASEQTGRICYMMELDPKYCDVIRKRYAKHIGSEDWEAVTPAIELVTA